MKRILFVSIAFPPKKDPECIQTGRYFHYLSKENRFHLDVLTSKSPTLFMPEDPSMKKYDVGWSQKVELDLFENKYLSFIQRKLWLSPLMLPDTKAHFHMQWKKVINKIEKKPDVIYSRSYPLSSAIAAYKLSKYYNVPWVLHLSDPWEDSPLHNYTPKEKDYHAKWERICFDTAQAICLTSQRSIDFYSLKYPEMESKIHLFPNVYDANEIQSNPHRFTSKLKLVYTGGLSGTRSPETFLKGLEIFNETSSKSDIVEVVFAGSCDRKMRSIIDRFNMPNFQHIGNLSLDSSQELQRTADVLLIIDSQIGTKELAMFFPSKILEYLGAQRRILALTTDGSSTQHIIDRLGFDSVDISDTNSIATQLETLAENFSNKNSPYFHIDSVPEEFSASRNASKLAELLDRV